MLRKKSCLTSCFSRFLTMKVSDHAIILRKNPFGWKFEDPPTISSFEFERIDPSYWQNWISENWKLSYYAGALYIIAILSLRWFMRNRPALELKGPLFIWNFALGIFSAFGFVRGLPELVYIVSQPGGLYRSLCVKDGMNAPSVFWGLLFALSKFWELGDHIFIVLRKKPLPFLQWYHHLMTLWVVWTIAPFLEPICRWYGVLNYGEHALLYMYFAVKTIGVKVPKKIAQTITTLQLIQMLVGLGVNMGSLYYLQTGNECARYPTSIRAFNLLYGSFIVLFGKLFYDSVIRTKSKPSREKSSKQN